MVGEESWIAVFEESKLVLLYLHILLWKKKSECKKETFLTITCQISYSQLVEQVVALVSVKMGTRTGFHLLSAECSS